MSNINSLANKTVVILGGSSGIGLATAKAAAAEGANVIIGSSSQQRIDKALEQLPEGSKGIAVDLGSEENIKIFFDKIGQLDHLVFTAGENLNPAALNEMDIDKTRQFLNIRYWGAIAAVKYGSPKINAGGSITLTSGTAGRRPMKGWAVIASLCTAMEGLTRALAIELAPLRVNCVISGFVKTDLWANVPEDHREAMYKAAAESMPLKHVAEPEELAEAYLHFIKQTYSTGQSIVIDGGGILV
jgi:NAD(P)-dependent dehydrogenase (short-subunit alcohol dehydrogenase family)